MSASHRRRTSNTVATAGTHATDVVAWTTKTGHPFYPVKVNTGNDSKFWGGDPPPKGEMFLLHKLKSKAIISDVMVGEDRTRLVHKKGVNVLYANGGAKWIDLKLVTPQFERAAKVQSPFDSQGNGNWVTHQIWNNLDAEQQLYP